MNTLNTLLITLLTEPISPGKDCKQVEGLKHPARHFQIIKTPRGFSRVLNEIEGLSRSSASLLILIFKI